MFKRKSSPASTASVVPTAQTVVPADPPIVVMSPQQVAEFFGRFDKDGKPDIGWVNEKVRRSCQSPLPARTNGKYRYFFRHEIEAWALSPDRLLSNRPGQVRKPRKRPDNKARNQARKAAA